jgi:hypothetical protein
MTGGHCFCVEPAHALAQGGIAGFGIRQRRLGNHTGHRRDRWTDSGSHHGGTHHSCDTVKEIAAGNVRIEAQIPVLFVHV